MEIRKADSKDIERIKQIDHQSSNPDRTAFIERTIADGLAWVAEIDSEVVAHTVLDHTFFERPTLSMLYIEESRRRQGIGNQIVEHMENVCNYSEIWTSTNLSNTPMQRLLRSRGYELSGLVDNLDPGDPELFYVKKLEKNGG